MTDQYSSAPRRGRPPSRENESIGRLPNVTGAAASVPNPATAGVTAGLRLDGPSSGSLQPVAEDRARPDRAEEVQTRRRRREGMGAERNLKLGIPQHLKDPNYELRWVNDRPGRVHQMTTLDDWEVVPGMEARTVDTSTGLKAVLLRKPKEFYDADKAEEAKLLDQRDDAMRRGPLPSPEGDASGDADKTYVPGGRNIVNGR